MFASVTFAKQRWYSQYYGSVGALYCWFRVTLNVQDICKRCEALTIAGLVAGTTSLDSVYGVSLEQ